MKDYRRSDLSPLSPVKYFALFALLASLVANLTLSGLLLGRSAKTTSSVETAPTHLAKTSRPADYASSADASASPASASPTDAPVWPRLATDDLSKLVANLKAANFPPEAIRAVVNALLDQKYKARMGELHAQLYNQPFWKTGAAYSDPKWRSALNAIQSERLKTTRDLLGTNVPNLEGRINRRARYGDLPDDKLDAVERIVTDYADLSSGNTFGVNFPWDRERQAALDSEKRKDLAAVLTPQELELYDLRTSATARNMRNRLVAFDTTEAEFRALFPLQHAFEEKYPATNTGASPERQAALEALNQEIKSVLGDARYADYTRSQDGGYRTAYLVADRLNLPPENASKVYDLQQDYKKRVSAISGDPAQSNEQKATELSQLAVEARGKLTALLTAGGVQAYLTSGGAWLRTLENPRPPARAAGGSAAPALTPR